MQKDKVEQQESQNSVNCPANPREDEAYQKGLVLTFCSKNDDGDEIDGESHEGREDHGEEPSVVLTANAVVNPHTVMIELLNTTEGRERSTGRNFDSVWISTSRNFSSSRRITAVLNSTASTLRT